MVDIKKSFSIVLLAALLTACNSSPGLNMEMTVAGPDVNANGVRDDVDLYINEMPETKLQKSALRQMSASLNSAMLVDTKNRNFLLLASNKITFAVGCIVQQYGHGIAGIKISSIEKLTVNTKPRSDAYEQFKTAIKGAVSDMPVGKFCINE